MRILKAGELKNMSVIFSVCGSNFCLFVSDMRKVTNQRGEIKPVNDETQKIFQINNRVLFGATGWFEGSEKITSPLDMYSDKSAITPHMAYHAVQEYIEAHKYHMPQVRNYLIGGKDGEGQFCVYEVHVNFETFQIEPRIWVPTGAEIAISCCLPASLASKKDDFIYEVREHVKSSKTLPDMAGKTAGVIGKMSALDSSIGTTAMALTVI